jgi:hypothetical protein
MAKYKVLKGEVGGFGGKTFAKDSICSDSDFPAGNAQDLEKMGYLQLIADTDAETDSDVEETETETETEETETETEETETEETEETADTDAETDSDVEETETETETEETETETEETETEETEETADTDAETDSDSEEKPLSIRSMNKSDIIQILVMKGIEFAENMNKEELYELYVKNF